MLFACWHVHCVILAVRASCHKQAHELQKVVAERLRELGRLPEGVSSECIRVRGKGA